jgi:tRNA threonylcarbamoyladenosine biosynthesis protein TsaB
MNVLAIDSSSSALKLAVASASKSYSNNNDEVKAHADAILLDITQCLKTAGISTQDLDLLAICNGPGSFIGLRTGLTVANTLAFAQSIPVVGVSSLQALAQAYYKQSGVEHVYVFVDARMNSVYFGDYSCVDGVMQPSNDDALFSVAEAAQIVAKIKAENQPASCIGNALACYPDFNYTSDDDFDGRESATAIVELALHALKLGVKSAGKYAQANYVRNKVAQTKQERGING